MRKDNNQECIGCGYPSEHCQCPEENNDAHHEELYAIALCDILETLDVIEKGRHPRGPELLMIAETFVKSIQMKTLKCYPLLGLVPYYVRMAILSPFLKYCKGWKAQD